MSRRSRADSNKKSRVRTGRRGNLAIAFATIGRPELVQRLVQSARRYLPDLPIYVADQSRQIDSMLPFYRSAGVRLVRMPFDAGVCASRNRLVAQINEQYFVLCDDDFIFDSRTDFADAVAILEACADIGVVGGRLFEVDHATSVRVRHWEMYLEYDPANGVLISIPMYHLLPVEQMASGVRFFLCDAVLNFAVFRRSIFSDRVRWDERFKSNGEHEDFYLNLKLHSDHRVAYLPSMVAEHHHANAHSRYDSNLRGRSEGWKLFLEKWQIKQHLELGLGARSLDDPGSTIGPQEARLLYRLDEPPQLHSGREGGARSARDVPWTESGLQRQRLCFRYDPIIRADTDFLLWFRPEPSTPTLSEGVGALSVHLRWYAADGSLLVWESNPFSLDLRKVEYWQPLSVEIPLKPADCPWLRFELAAACGSKRVPLCTGYCFDQDKGHSSPEADAQSQDVLAFGGTWDPAADLADLESVQSLMGKVPTDSIALTVSQPDASDRCLFIHTDRPVGLKSLLIVGCGDLGSKLMGIRLPIPELGAPSVFAIPDVRVGVDTPRIIGKDHADRLLDLRLPNRPIDTTMLPLRKVTAVLTSCGRQDLLERTLDSFFEFNSFPLERIIVVEDGHAGANAALMRKFKHHPMVWLGTNWRVGQIDAIDCAYALVDTEFIFHLEDDWEFYSPGFIEKSIPILDARPECFEVLIRAIDDINGHPLLPDVESVAGVAYRRLTLDYLGSWHGFSFNPGLRRTADYRRIGSYGEHVGHDRFRPTNAEADLSLLYRNLGFYCVILSDNEGRGYVRHLGDGRRVTNFG